MSKIKESRVLSFIAVALIYVSATVVGIVSYKYLPFNYEVNLLIADVLATVFTFIFSLIFSNASVYDPYWSVQPMVVCACYALDGLNVTGVIALCVICFWGVRLTANWAYTFHGLKYQDWRYTMLHDTTGKTYPLINFVGIHLVPTLVVYFCTVPAVAVIENMPTFTPFCLVGTVISVFAVILQIIADTEMQNFRKLHTGKLIRVGLWKYSRHPNYLGEILMWWGIGIYAVILMPDKWIFLLGAILNTLLFTFVSIPMADKRQSKKDGYAEYKAQTRALLPIKKKAVLLDD